METSLAAYRSQAEALAQAFLNAGLDDLVQRTEDETRRDVLYKHMLNLNSGLQSQLNTINQTLAGKRTFVGWLRDVGGNLIVNVVTILVIGAAVLGYNILGKVQQHTEKEVGLGASEAASAASSSPDAAKH